MVYRYSCICQKLLGSTFMFVLHFKNHIIQKSNRNSTKLSKCKYWSLWNHQRYASLYIFSRKNMSDFTLCSFDLKTRTSDCRLFALFLPSLISSGTSAQHSGSGLKKWKWLIILWICNWYLWIQTPTQPTCTARMIHMIHD